VPKQPYNGPIDQIDWDAIWEHQMSLTSFAGTGVEYWNARAKEFPNISKADRYVDEMLHRMELSPKFSVLDVGCGTGAMAIPMAKKVSQVTALDASPAMLDILKTNIASAEIKNIRLVNADWPKTKIGIDIKPHDVVLASRCIPMGNLRQSLVNMDRVAKRLCYLTWITGGDESRAKACRILGMEYHPFPDHIIIFNMLYGMGIHANVEIFDVRNIRRFQSVDDAVRELVRGQHVEIEQHRKSLEALVREEFPCENGCYCKDTTMKWALIWWRKK
jgi:SAM-dependent methyltransferase